jgi:serine/threonine protein kinase
MDAPHELITYGGRRFMRIKLSVRRKSTLCTVPQRIAGRYEVREMLAHGGGGIVLVGYDVPTNHEVLIKAALGYRLKRYARHHDTAGALEHLRRVRHRLQTERRILVQLRRRGANAVPHPHNFVYDFNPGLTEPLPGTSWRLEDPDLLASEPFLVMQWIHGIGLDALRRQRYPDAMPPPLALDLVQQVVAVLQLLHRPFQLEGRTWELVYQDIKPANILVSDGNRATLVDFGGCQLVIDGTLVLNGAHTPGYCPPEQTDRRRWLAPDAAREAESSGAEMDSGPIPLTAAADVYCVGSTLYHLLTGTNPQKLLPSKASEQEPTANRRGSHRPGRAVMQWDWQRLDGCCPAAVSRLVRRCLEPDPRDRFPDADTLAEEMRAL